MSNNSASSSLSGNMNRGSGSGSVLVAAVVVGKVMGMVARNKVV